MVHVVVECLPGELPKADDRFADDFFPEDFLADVFFDVDFLAEVFLAADFFAEVFFAEVFFAVALPPLLPAFFFCWVVPPWLGLLFDALPEPLFLPPRFEAPGEFAIFAARSLDMPLSLSASYCFSFFTLARVAMSHLRRRRYPPVTRCTQPVRGSYSSCCMTERSRCSTRRAVWSSTYSDESPSDGCSGS